MMIGNNAEDREGKPRVMSRTAVGRSGSFGRLSGGCKSGLRSHLVSCRGRPPERTGDGCSLLPVGLSRDHQTFTRDQELNDVLLNQTGVGVCDCDPTCTELSFREEPENRKREKSECFAMDGRRVSSLSVGSNESEGSGGTRVGESFQKQYFRLLFL